MSKELVISATPHETRVAIMEDGQLCEIYIEREKEFALVGSLYKGRVTRVLPGMQSAFVDIGLDSDAFLYVSDFLEHLEEYDHVAPAEPKAQKPQARSNEVYPPTTNGGAVATPAAAPVPVSYSPPVERLPRQSHPVEQAEPYRGSSGHHPSRRRDPSSGGRWTFFCCFSRRLAAFRHRCSACSILPLKKAIWAEKRSRARRPRRLWQSRSRRARRTRPALRPPRPGRSTRRPRSPSARARFAVIQICFAG